MANPPRVAIFRFNLVQEVKSLIAEFGLPLSPPFSMLTLITMILVLFNIPVTFPEIIDGICRQFEHYRRIGTQAITGHVVRYADSEKDYKPMTAEDFKNTVLQTLQRFSSMLTVTHVDSPGLPKYSVSYNAAYQILRPWLFDGPFLFLALPPELQDKIYHYTTGIPDGGLRLRLYKCKYREPPLVVNVIGHLNYLRGLDLSAMMKPFQVKGLWQNAKKFFYGVDHFDLYGIYQALETLDKLADHQSDRLMFLRSISITYDSVQQSRAAAVFKLLKGLKGGQLKRLVLSMNGLEWRRYIKSHGGLRFPSPHNYRGFPTLCEIKGLNEILIVGPHCAAIAQYIRNNSDAGTVKLNGAIVQ